MDRMWYPPTPNLSSSIANLLTQNDDIRPVEVQRRTWTFMTYHNLCVFCL